MVVSRAQGEYEQLEREREKEGKRELDDGAEDGREAKRVRGNEEDEMEMEMEMEMEDDEDGASTRVDPGLGLTLRWDSGTEDERE